MANDNRPRLAMPKDIGALTPWLLGLCALLLVIDFFVAKHGKFDLEHYWGFYGFFGFAAVVALVIAAKALRFLVNRPEDYYDDE